MRKRIEGKGITPFDISKTTGKKNEMECRAAISHLADLCDRSAAVLALSSSDFRRYDGIPAASSRQPRGATRRYTPTLMALFPRC